MRKIVVSEAVVSPNRPRQWITGTLVTVSTAIAVVAIYLAASARIWAQAGGQTSNLQIPQDAQVQAKSVVDAGRYLILVGGCNDCHTPGFMEKGLSVPESQWLTGVPVGWRGPWGTTYASNLRLYVEDFPNADAWVKLLRARTAKPPMPWSSLHAMSDNDLKAIFAYIKNLGPSGQMMPLAAPPGMEPKTPYLSMEPQSPKGAP